MIRAQATNHPIIIFHSRLRTRRFFLWVMLRTMRKKFDAPRIMNTHVTNCTGKLKLAMLSENGRRPPVDTFDIAMQMQSNRVRRSLSMPIRPMIRSMTISRNVSAAYILTKLRADVRISWENSLLLPPNSLEPRFLPPIPIIGRRNANTNTTVIPPNHWIMALQRRMEWGVASKSFSMEEPVVVNPEMPS